HRLRGNPPHGGHLRPPAAAEAGARPRRPPLHSDRPGAGVPVRAPPGLSPGKIRLPRPTHLGDMRLAVAPTRDSLTVVWTGWHGRVIPAPSKFRSPTPLDPSLRAAVVALRPVLLVLARRMCASEADAADVVHDALESALEAGDRLKAVENLQAWLVTILHRRVIDLFRKREREQLGDPPEEPGMTQEPPPADAPLWTRINFERLRAAVERLEPEFREVFTLHAFERRSYRDIAATLDIPQATVGTRLLRARRKLRVL